MNRNSTFKIIKNDIEQNDKKVFKEFCVKITPTVFGFMSDSIWVDLFPMTTASLPLFLFDRRNSSRS